MARNLGFGPDQGQIREATQQMRNLYNLFINVDATQVEINPFGVTDKGKSTFLIIFTSILYSCFF
jgi:succinyl-CoA synthetase beta subunit